EAELEDFDDDDDGIPIGGGLRGAIYTERQVSVHARGGFRYIREDYGPGAAGDLLELETGIVARYALSDRFGAYGGVDLVPYSDGEVEAGPADTDIERDDIIGLRLGADFRLDPVVINAEFGLISEDSFVLRVTLPI